MHVILNIGTGASTAGPQKLSPTKRLKRSLAWVMMTFGKAQLELRRNAGESVLVVDTDWYGNLADLRNQLHDLCNLTEQDCVALKVPTLFGTSGGILVGPNTVPYQPFDNTLFLMPED